jgi:hypothetical protein
LDVLAHASDTGGVTEFELSANGQVVGTSPAVDAKLTLARAGFNWQPGQPGRYILKIRARSAGGGWGPYTETIVTIIGEVLTATGVINGTVIADQNGNGLRDLEEGPLEGANVALKGCGPDATAFSAPDGTFQFTHIPAGSCTLEVFKDGWKFTASPGAAGYPIPVASDPNSPAVVGILMAPEPVRQAEPAPGVPQLSSTRVYYGAAGCDPAQVTIQFAAGAPDGVKAVFLFHRSHGTNGDDSGWSEGISMNSIGTNQYSLTVSGNTLVGSSGITTEASMSYQFVIQTQKDEYVRSTVYSDLLLSPCGSPPPDDSNPPGIIIIPGLIIVTPTPTFPVIH